MANINNENRRTGLKTGMPRNATKCAEVKSIENPAFKT
jgi:hypothetical protein